MDADSLQELLAGSRETRNIEFKRSMLWSKLRGKLVRSILAMTNTRDGGTIVIGVRQEKSGFVFEGATDADLASYKEDDIAAFVASYADPYVRLHYEAVQLDDGRKFGVITVFEFDEIPVICRQSGEEVRQGAIYVRGNRIPESVEVPSQTELREILELALEKGFRKRLAFLGRVGAIPTAGPEDATRFADELGGL